MRSVITAFGDDDCGFLAGAVAYQIFFALIPLLALVIGIVAFAAGAERANALLTDIFRQIYPSATAQEAELAEQLVEGRGISLGVGIVGTLLSVTGIYGSLDSAIAAVFGRPKGRTFLRQKVVSFAFIGALGLLGLVSFAVTYGVQIAQGLLESLGVPPVLRWSSQALSLLVGLLVSYLFFLLIYRVVPRERVRRRASREAALVSAVLWEVAKVAFGLYTRALDAFAAYGAIAFAAGLLTWIYVTAIIILIGAEVMKTRPQS